MPSENPVDDLDLEDAFKAELKKFLEDSRKSGSDFIKRQSESLVSDLAYFAEGKISKKVLKGLIEDTATLTQMYAAMESASGKKRLLDFSTKVGDILLKRLIAAI